MTTHVCLCGNTNYETVYDRIPYGSTMELVPADQVCTQCGRSVEDGIEWCENCNRPDDRCKCGADEEEEGQGLDSDQRERTCEAVPMESSYSNNRYPGLSHPWNGGIHGAYGVERRR